MHVLRTILHPCVVVVCRVRLRTPWWHVKRTGTCSHDITWSSSCRKARVTRHLGQQFERLVDHGGIFTRVRVPMHLSRYSIDIMMQVLQCSLHCDGLTGQLSLILLLLGVVASLVPCQ
jgi:hypothetical protein